MGKPFGYGYNAATDEYGDLVAMGVLDPAKVTINALENSASVAGLILTTEALIAELPRDLSEAEKIAQIDRDAGMGAMDYM
jgi:chaperonin GroEL